MKNLWWQTIGTGNNHLVLLHGWGMNAEIWHCIQDKLTSLFTLHLVDLPGFGRSQGYSALSLDNMTQYIMERAPQKSIWLGWSLGGLIASHAALIYPKRIKALVTVASSPCFIARNKLWPGIKTELLNSFQQQLSYNFRYTIERFLTLQTIGTDTTRQDAYLLKQIIFALPLPSVEALNEGLEILKTTDLREALVSLRLPHLRLYGYLDGLVPRKIVPLLDNLWPQSKSIVIPKAAHAPFISHPNEFCTILKTFIKYLK